MTPPSAGRPLVVRFGPWARNLYLGLPAAFAFAIIPFAAAMPLWVHALWNIAIAVMVWLCAFPREVRVYPHDRVEVVRRFLALVPVAWRSYPLSAFTGISQVSASFAMSDSPTIASDTVHLVLASGRHIPVQSYSDGADNQPPRKELVTVLRELTGLPLFD